MAEQHNLSNDSTLAYLLNSNDKKVNALRAELIDLIYPVGSIYMSVNNASPQTFLGGKWERITGRFLLAATDGGAAGGNSTATVAPGGTGGSATHVHATKGHTLTVSEMPSHNHEMSDAIVYREKGYMTNSWGTGKSDHENSSYKKYTASVGGGGSHSHGDTEAGASMPPYLAVYIWKRKA